MYRCTICEKRFQYPHIHYFNSGFISQEMCPFCGTYDIKEVS